MKKIKRRVENYQRLQADMLKTFVNKDSDYGDSFGKTYEKYGIVSALTRMSDKLNRIDNLTAINARDSSAKMKVDESIEDTLLDLANYAMLTYLEIHKFDEPVPPLWSVSENDKASIKPGEINLTSAGITTGELNKKAGNALATISKKLEEAQAKGSNKKEDVAPYRAAMGTGEFNRRQLAITKDGAKFHWEDTDETLELEETADYDAYVNSHESLEDMVNNLYPQLIN